MPNYQFYGQNDNIQVVPVQLVDGNGVPIVFNSNGSIFDSASDGVLKTIRDSLSVMDDWDESDRAKVNLIVGQTGVQGGSGTVSANTQRTVLATDVGLPAGTNMMGAIKIRDGSGIFNSDATVLTIAGLGILGTVPIGGTGNILGVTATGQLFCLTGSTDNTIGNSGFLLIDSARRVVVQQAFSTRADTYTGTGNGTTIDASIKPPKSFSIQVKGTGAAATAWDVRLEGSNDNTNFVQILQHTNLTGDGAMIFSGTVLSPCLYIRSRCAGLTLGSATNIVVTILGTA